VSAAPNWAEQLTAIATTVGAVGLLGAIVAAIYAGQQVREARMGREAQLASDLFGRWNDEALVEARRLFASFKTPAELAAAFVKYVAEDAPEAYVLYRELDYFEQLSALERRGAVDFELIKLILGRQLVARWEAWKPALRAALGVGVYPLFESLASKMRDALADPMEAPARRAG
jgi:hypothetical protein